MSAALITTRELQLGDIILSTTSAIDSAIIREGTASQFSHSALYAGFVQGLDKKGVSTRVIEATGKKGVFDPTLFDTLGIKRREKC